MTSLPTPLLPRNRWKNQTGAFDLPSILVGVVVVGILTAGVLAAIFGVIPFAQDRGVKQDLASVNTAQGVSYAKDGGFLDKPGLVDAGLLGSGLPDDLDVRATGDGECYVAVGTAGSGEKFILSNDETNPRELTSKDEWCDGQTIAPDRNDPVMISTWNTSQAESCREITLPIKDFKGTVNWGDGTADTKTTHTFTKSGPVVIRIDGTFTTWGGSGWADVGCLVSVDLWGATDTTNLGYAFAQATNLRHIESIPSSTKNLSSAFRDATSDFTIGQFDTSNVTTMANMFSGATAFNQPVNFDTSKVTTIYSMFLYAAAFNQPVKFDTSNVTSMSAMFSGATAFNQPVNFDTSKVTSMYSMFSRAISFNQPLDFDTSNVTDMSYMFYGARAYSQPLDFTDTSKVTAMDWMFYDSGAFNQPVDFDTSKVTDMSYMFSGASAFNQPLDFDTSNVTSMDGMFKSADAFNQDLSGWNVGEVTNHGSFSSGSIWTLPKPNWVN